MPLAPVYRGGVRGQGVLGGVHPATQVAGEAFRLHGVLVQDVSLEVVLVRDDLVAVGTGACRVQQRAALGLLLLLMQLMLQRLLMPS